MKLKKPIRKHHIPSIFTLINIFLGFLAIISIVEEQFARAAYLIIAASLFDVLDGKLARKFDVPSRFGSELDSLADMVSFCLAPSLFIWALYVRDLHPIIGALLAGSPLLFGALRLARYNLESEGPPRSYFVGIPTPTTAMVIVALYFYYAPTGHAGAGKVVLPIVMATSFLMVSQVRYAKFPRVSLHGGLKNMIKLALIFATAILFFFVDKRFGLPMVMIYLVSGLVKHLAREDVGPEFLTMRRKT